GALVVEVQLVLDVPGDGLALAVGVGRQQDAVGLAGLALELGQDVLGRAALAVAAALVALLDDVGGHPAGVDVDAGDGLAAAAALGQVAHVAVAGQHLVVGAEVFVDRLGLGRRLDDDEVVLAPGAVARGQGGAAALPGRRGGSGVLGCGRGGLLAAGRK